MNNEYIESLILQMCKKPRSYEYLSRNLFGLDPIELLTHLKSMQKAKKLKSFKGFWVGSDYENAEKKSITASFPSEFLNQHIGFFNLYKKPHPLDYEWRNATETINYLTTFIAENTTSSESILLLGMPTLFANFCANDIPNPVKLIDNNGPVVAELRKRITSNRFKVLEKDIFKTSAKDVGQHSIVFMDPPWYSPHFYQFIWLASQCLELGGVLGISLPPINTRPGIEIERLEWFQFCLNNGLVLENLYAQKLQYAMPFFEYNAFKSAGISNILPIWRKGDLALFRKIKTVQDKRPILKGEKLPWTEIEIEGVRFRIDTNQSNDKTIKIKTIVEGDILPSVSTRDSRRSLANIWTSGNRIFNVNNPELFLELITSKSKGSANFKLVREFIDKIVQKEKAEYDTYLEWLYHEMERQID